jgi:hypothetical protein
VSEEGCDTLFYLPGPDSIGFAGDEKVCCGVISSGQGIRRFCTLSMPKGEKTCGVVSHSVKAKLVGNAFFVQTKVKGGSGALSTKTLSLDDIRREDRSYFFDAKLAPEEWEAKFDEAKLLKYSAGGPAMTLIYGEKTSKEAQGEQRVPDYMPTPKKPRTVAEEDSPTSQESWVQLPSISEVKGLKTVLPATDDSPGRKAKNIEAIGYNFNILQTSLPRMAEQSADSLAELREQFGKLAKAMQKVDRRLGVANGFGMMASVTSAFDGLRYLHEVGEERDAKFSKYPYDRVIRELAELDNQVASLQTVDRWTEEATNLRKLNQQLANSVADLRNKTVSRLVEFYHKFTTNRSPIPGDLLSKELAQLQNSISVLESGGQSRPHTQVGFDFYGNQQGSSAQLDSILARLSKSEAENARLSTELQVLKTTQVSSGAGIGPPRPADPSHTTSFEHRLAALESAGDLETVVIGPQTFKNIQDCEAFLYASVPASVLDTYAYDMVSLIHRLGRESSTSGAVSREHAAAKAGFLTSGSATLFSSFQQALPGPFGVSSGTANSSLQPIPALKDYPTWDRQDGMTGLKNDVSNGIMSAMTAINTAMSRDLLNHPLAMMLFGSMLSTASLQWHQFAMFVSERYNTSLYQIEDPKEAWLFTSEIIKGVYTELHKIRVMAADRTSSVHNHKDAARSLWVALQTQRLMGEFIALKFVGHPKLSPYSINHLFRHRVPLKMVETLTTKVTKIENDVRSVVALQGKMKSKYPV